MLIRATVICVVMEIGIIFHGILLPFAVEIFGQSIDIPLNIFINCYTIFSRAVLPTIYFICNKQAHNIVKHLFLRLRARFVIGKATVVIQVN